MSEFEDPQRVQPGRDVTVDDVRQLMGASRPHFALQLRNRIRNQIADLPGDHPARIEGEREIRRLNGIAFTGEHRGPTVEREPEMPGLRTPDNDAA